MTQETNDVVERILTDIAREEADSGGPDDGNPWHTFTTRISDVKALLAALQSQSAHIAELEGERSEISYHAAQLATYLAQSTLSERQVVSARFHNGKIVSLTKDSTSG